MEMITYTVRPGNTLYAIAQFFGTTVKEIAEANGLSCPYTIYPGQQLVLPIEEIKSPRYYVVRPGDTIVSIADRYGLEIENILALNNLEDPNIIYPGQILRLTK
ncbi:LysM peptidoglycan-binding domain-containing protein [uncultured Ruminococcus sp.]|jgi:LysM repeat protein|uniref:lytic transglycosylase n=1 Tax=uncultured Ruminococcus sp. TaxID=165186 RepID=UPI00292F3010|nr:LysM peptidoglycan-binding domain-containing protein [uncultured Ruminococcus sp.]